jgi:hypothetical protein
VGAAVCETLLQPQHDTFDSTLMAQQKHKPQLIDRKMPDGDASSFSALAPQQVIDPFVRIPQVCCNAAATLKKVCCAGTLV